MVCGLKWSVSWPGTWVTRTLWMLLSRSIFSATWAPVRPPGKGTSEYLRNTDLRRACTAKPAMPITTISRNMPVVAAEYPAACGAVW